MAVVDSGNGHGQNGKNKPPVLEHADGTPLDLDEISALEAEQEAGASAGEKFKRIVTPVTKEDIQVFKRFFPYIRPYLGKVVLAMVLSAAGGALATGTVLLIERAFSAFGVDSSQSARKGGKKGLAAPLGAPTGTGTAGQAEPPGPIEPADPQDPAEPDQPPAPKQTTEEMKRALGEVSLLFMAVILLSSLCKFAQTFIMTRVSRKAIRKIREDCFKHLVRLPLAFHQTTHSGKLTARIIKDVNRLKMLLTTVMTNGMREVFIFLTALGYIMYKLGWMAVFALLFVIAAVIPIRLVADKIRHRDKSAEAGSGDLFAILSEAIAGQKVVKAFTAEKYETRRFKAATRSLYHKQMITQRLRALTEPLVDMVGGIGIAGAIWFLGGWVIEGNLQAASLVALVFALQKLNASLRKMGKLQNDWVRGIAAATRVNRILDQEAEIREAPEAVPLKKFSDGIEYRNVSFRYNKAEPVLKDISFHIRRGEMVAIVGPSGAGKTSMVDLIPRLRDVDEGAILMDGRDIREYTLKSLRHQIGVVSQDTMLFRDSIAENISYGLKEVRQEAVVAAAKAANAHDFISAKKNGYDTPLGERGGRLSGGERQRIAIARAILKNPPILILDEATSALDAESEAMVQNALAFLMEGRTTIVIAHRLTTIRQADRIVVLAQGQIEEIGTHEELMANGNRYARAYNLQMEALSRGEKETSLDEFFVEGEQ